VCDRADVKLTLPLNLGSTQRQPDTVVLRKPVSNHTFITIIYELSTSPVCAQGRLIGSDKDYEPNVNMRIVGRAPPEQSGYGAELADDYVPGCVALMDVAAIG